jgi:L-alanine-DL-glutamate epimerase-like enolase superfamily enzyme
MQASLRPATSNRMLVIDSETVLLKKKVPLTITRGTRAESRLLWVRVCSEGVEGWGEAGEFSVGPLRQDLAELETQAQRVASMLAKEDPFDRAAMEQVMLRSLMWLVVCAWSYTPKWLKMRTCWSPWGHCNSCPC